MVVFQLLLRTYVVGGRGRLLLLLLLLAIATKVRVFVYGAEFSAIETLVAALARTYVALDVVYDVGHDFLAVTKLVHALVFDGGVY